MPLSRSFPLIYSSPSDLNSLSQLLDKQNIKNLGNSLLQALEKNITNQICTFVFLLELSDLPVFLLDS